MFYACTAPYPAESWSIIRTHRCYDNKNNRKELWFKVKLDKSLMNAARIHANLVNMLKLTAYY